MKEVNTSNNIMLINFIEGHFLNLIKNIYIFCSKIEIEDEDGNLTVSSRTSSISLPPALPLRRSNQKPIRRHGEWDNKEKDSKISKILQLSITTLSFLAFGGYLLTMVIMAIRRTTAAPTTSSVILLSVKYTL